MFILELSLPYHKEHQATTEYFESRTLYFSLDFYIWMVNLSSHVANHALKLRDFRTTSKMDMHMFGET